MRSLGFEKSTEHDYEDEDIQREFFKSPLCVIDLLASIYPKELKKVPDLSLESKLALGKGNTVFCHEFHPPEITSQKEKIQKFSDFHPFGSKFLFWGG